MTQSPDWLQNKALLFQPGDLPDGVQAGQFNTAAPDWLRDKLGLSPDAAASLAFERAGMQFGFGGVQVFFFADPASARQLYQSLVPGLASGQSQGVPQPGIADAATLFFPDGDGHPYQLFLRQCRSVAQVTLFSPPADQQTILNYAARLAQRLAAVDCQGAASIPVLTPPASLPTPTSSPTVAITKVISPTVQRLPDPDGANLIRAYAFADAEHGWLALGASILATADGGQNWREQFQVESPVVAIVFDTPQLGWIQTQTGYFQTRDGGASWQRVAARPAGGKPLMPAPELIKLEYGETYRFCSDPARLAASSPP